MRCITGCILLAIGLLPGLAFSEGLDGDQAGVLCTKVSRQIDGRLKVKGLTLCIPASDTKGGNTNIIMLFAKPDLADDDMAYWVTASLRAVLGALHEGNGLPGVHTVFLQDGKLRSQKKMLTLTTGQVQEIGERIQKGEIKTPKELLEQVNAYQGKPAKSTPGGSSEPAKAETPADGASDPAKSVKPADVTTDPAEAAKPAGGAGDRVQ